jgi:hypothetical protein
MKFQGAAMITNQTPLTALEARIEQAANERMIPLLLANELKRHTRRGNRGCDCEYCKVKRTPVFVLPSQLRYDFIEIESRVHLVRLEQINTIRKKLSDILIKAGGGARIRKMNADSIGKAGTMITIHNGTGTLFSARNVPT